MKKKTLSAVALLALTIACPIQAQEAYTIYPIPQQMVDGTAKVVLTKTVTVVCENGIDQYTRERAQQVLADHGHDVQFADAPSTSTTNLFLGINGSKGTADATADQIGLKRDVFTKVGKYDRHALALTAEGIVALGENTDATFFALASLEQILDHEAADGLPSVTIYDYADQKSRGLVEGFYGYPYSVDVKKDLMRFMMRYKMNTYLYGAKSDPYHSNYWKQPYPTTITAEQKKNGWLSQDMIKEIATMSHQTKVNFIWAIHPGNDFIYSSSVVNDIMTKYTHMYKLGVRQFAVFVDDVGVPDKDADLKANADHLTQLQKALEKKYNQPTAEANDTVRPLHFVPQVYCSNFASADVRKRFFGALASTPDYVTIYTTGNGVWSVPNSSDLNTVKQDLGRNVQWWWNYPCNDNADGQIYTMDMYSNFYDLPSVDNNAKLPSQLNNGLGIVSNPMQQGEVSKTALFSVADYAWNNSKFNNAKSWEASYKYVLPGNEEAQKAYRFLAEYLRYNDPTALNEMISKFKTSGDAAGLSSLMQEVAANCEVLIRMKNSESESERLLYNDLAPWLLKLNAMAKLTNDLIATSVESKKELTEEVWNGYISEINQVAALSTAEDFKAYALEGMGNSISVSVRPSQPSQRYLLGFIDYLKKNALGDTFNAQMDQKAATSFSNVDGLTAKVSGASKLSIIQAKPFTLKKGEYIGIKLVSPTMIPEITVSDTLLANHTIVMSENGKTWTRITSATTAPEGYVRFVGVVNDNEAPTTLKLVQKSIQVTLPEKSQIKETTIPSGNIWNNMTKDKMTDKNYTTFVCLNRNQQNGDAYTLRLTKQQPVRLVRIGMGTVNQDYMNAAKVQISTDGKKWTDLKVKGTTTTDFKMSLPQVMPISDEVSICDFDGEGQEALYVRLYVSQANTSKWLRLYEIEVNGEGAFTQMRCTDGAGVSLPQTNDADASTSTAHAQKNLMTYYFQELHSLRSITLYNDPATTSQAEIEVSEDCTNWKSAGKFSSSIQQVDMTAQPNATMMRIVWTGKVAPAIYEIIENADPDKQPHVTRIGEVTSEVNRGGDAVVSVSNGQTSIRSAKGIASVQVFSAEGRLCYSAQLDNAKSLQLPSIQQNSINIIRLTLADGSVQTFKVR